MEYAKDEVFDIHYDEDQNRIYVKKQKRMLELIKKNKFIVSIVVLALTLSIVDSILISQFIRLLSTI